MERRFIPLSEWRPGMRLPTDRPRRSPSPSEGPSSESPEMESSSPLTLDREDSTDSDYAFALSLQEEEDSQSQRSGQRRKASRTRTSRTEARGGAARTERTSPTPPPDGADYALAAQLQKEEERKAMRRERSHEDDWVTHRGASASARDSAQPRPSHADLADLLDYPNPLSRRERSGRERSGGEVRIQRRTLPVPADRPSRGSSQRETNGGDDDWMDPMRGINAGGRGLRQILLEASQRGGGVGSGGLRLSTVDMFEMLEMGRSLSRSGRIHAAVDSNDYDMLSRLEDVKVGVPPEIMTNLPTWRFSSEQQSGETGSCNVCLSDYEGGEELCSLPCFHIFHFECIAEWLKEQQSCPVCKANVVDMYNEQQRGSEGPSSQTVPE